MKKITYYIAFSLLITAGTVFSSCQKSTVKPKKALITGPIPGYWYGSFLNHNGFGASVGILFRSDGTLKMYDFYGASSQTDTTAALIATVTFTITGNTVNFSYAFATESFTAQGTINTSASPATLPYTFTDPNSTGASGNANLSKQSN